MSKSKVVIAKHAYERLRKHVYATGFRYETGGVLIGYRWCQKFYVVAFTFPRPFRNADATKMTFVLNGEEHTEEMERIKSKYILQPKLIGVWHSHTTEDDSFSLQDRMSNNLLVSQIGEMLSIIVMQRKRNGIQLIPYYISEENQEVLCRARIVGHMYKGRANYNGKHLSGKGINGVSVGG